MAVTGGLLELPAAQEIGLYQFYQETDEPIAIVSVPSGLILERNESFSRLLNLPRGEGGEETILDLAAPGTSARVRRMLAGWNGEEESWTDRAEFRVRGGEIVRRRAGLLPIQGSFPTVALFHLAGGRRKEKAQLRELIEDRIEQLRNLEHLRSLGEFSSIVVHEIRTPLTSIRVVADFLRRSDGLDSRMRERLDTVLEQVERIDHLLSSIREFGKPIRLQPRSLAFRELAAAVRNTVGARFPDLQWMARGLRAQVYADPERLREALENVTLNSAEATNGKGRVMLSACRSRGHPGWTSVVVTDDGPGIAAQELPRVFQLFFTTKRTGTGLGLSVVKKIVDLHGGKIALDSAPGRGTRVTMMFPPGPARTKPCAS